MYESDPIAAKKIRDALATPIEDPARIKLPKPTPPEQYTRMPLKPLPVRGQKKVVPR